MLQRSWDAVSHRRVQRPCVRLGYHLKTPHQSLQMIRHHARLSGSANFRDAGYENLISSRPSSALNRKLHRRVVQGKEATSDLRTRLCLRNLQDEEQEPPQNTTNTGKVILHCIILKSELNCGIFLFQAQNKRWISQHQNQYHFHRNPDQVIR